MPHSPFFLPELLQSRPAWGSFPIISFPMVSFEDVPMKDEVLIGWCPCLQRTQSGGQIGSLQAILVIHSDLINSQNALISGHQPCLRMMTQ